MLKHYLLNYYEYYIPILIRNIITIIIIIIKTIKFKNLMNFKKNKDIFFIKFIKPYKYDNIQNNFINQNLLFFTVL